MVFMMDLAEKETENGLFIFAAQKLCKELVFSHKTTGQTALHLL